MRLYLIRHADPDYPNNTITPAGHAEARALSTRLAREQLTALYSSPLGRAQDTARYTAQVTGLPVAIEPWTQELGQLRLTAGPVPGNMAWDLHAHCIRQRLDLATHDAWHQMQFLDEPAIRQTCRQVADDSDAFLARHGYQREGTAYRATRPNTDRIAVFCHGGFGLTWLAHLLAIPTPLVWAGFWLPPSSVTIILLDQREPELATPRCLCVGDTSHLHAHDLPILPAGIKSNYY